MNVDVSVVLPAYRAADRIGAAIRSVLRQTHADLELIVVDDGSGDGTAAAAREAAADDPRVTVVERVENGGSTRARSTGVSHATGDYVWFCDVDDEWHDDLLSQLLSVARRTGADVVVCRAERVERNGRTGVMEGVDVETELGPVEVTTAVLDGTVRGYLWNKVFRRSLLRPVDRAVLTSQDDHLVVLDALARARTTVLVPDVLYRYRDTPGSISDSAMLRLDNVEQCATATIEWASRVRGSTPPPQLVEHFECWFLLVPALTTPAHQGWPRAAQREVRHRFGGRLRWRHVRACAAYDRRRAVHAAALVVLGPAFGAVYRSVGRLAGFSVQAARPASSSPE